MEPEASVGAALTIDAWAELSDPDMTVEQAVAELSAAGNQIIEVDYDGRRVKVAHSVTPISIEEARAFGLMPA